MNSIDLYRHRGIKEALPPNKGQAGWQANGQVSKSDSEITNMLILVFFFVFFCFFVFCFYRYMLRNIANERKSKKKKRGRCISLLYMHVFHYFICMHLINWSEEIVFAMQMKRKSESVSHNGNDAECLNEITNEDNILDEDEDLNFESERKKARLTLNHGSSDDIINELNVHYFQPLIPVSKQSEIHSLFFSTLSTLSSCFKIQFTLGEEIPNDVHVFISSNPSLQVLKNLPNLKALMFPYAGVKEEIVRTFSSHLPNVSIHNLHHNATSTAEMAMALLMSVAKRILPADQLIRKNDWSSSGGLRLTAVNTDVTNKNKCNGVGTGSESNENSKPKPLPDPLGQIILEGKTCIVLGYGNVGKKIARMVCDGIGMKVKAFTRSATLPATKIGCQISPENNEVSVLSSPRQIHNETSNGDNSEDFDNEYDSPEYEIELHPISELKKHLPKATALVLAIPGNSETKGIISREMLELLPLQSIVINVGRGELIDEEALYNM